MTKLTKEEFDAKINENKWSLILFGATWCGKCSMAKQKIPAYEEALKDAKLDCTIYNIDADECKDTFEKYGVKHMPVFILFKDGVNAGQRSALGTPDGIVQFVLNNVSMGSAQ